MFSNRYKLVCAALAGLAAALIGLPVASVLAAPTTRTSVPARLVGTWGKTVTWATWRKNQISYEKVGHWAIKISEGGVTSIFEPPGKPSVYPYPLTTMRVAGSSVWAVFGPTADGFCPHKASYTWKVSGRTLVLKVVKDDCDARRVLLTAGSWKRA